MKFLIDQNLAQAILNYLQEQPFKNVAGLISAMSQLQPEGGPDGKLQRTGKKDNNVGKQDDKNRGDS